MLNQLSKFGKFYYDENRAAIVLEHDLLGDYLDSEELLNAVRTVGAHADRSDDELRQALGTGERAIDRAPDKSTVAVEGDQLTGA